MTIKKRKLSAVVGLLLLCAATVTVFAAGSKKSKSSKASEVSFKVALVTPQGEMNSDIKYPKVQIHFTKPVVALTALGQQTATCDYASIEPALNGYWKWTTTSTLSFISTDEVIPQKLYTVKVKEDLKSITGEKLTDETTFYFFSERLKMLAVHPGYTEVSQGKYVDNYKVPLEQAKDVGVLFNTKVNVDHVKQWIYVTSSGYRIPYDIKAANTEYEVVLTLKKDLEEGASVRVVLEEGASADVGCISTRDSDQELSFYTIPEFNIENCYYDTYSYGYSNPVVVIFNTPLKAGTEDEIAKYITTDLEGFKVKKDNVDLSGARLTLSNFPVKYNSSYTLTIKGGLKDVYGRSLGSNYTKTIEIPSARSYASFKDSGNKMLESQFLPKIAFEHQNIQSGSEYRVSGVLDNKGKALTKEKSAQVELDPEKIPDDTTVIEVVDLSKYLTKVGKEYRGLVQFNADMKYIYRYYDWWNEGYETRQSSTSNNLLVQVTDLGASVRFGNDSAAVMVTSLKTGEPVKKAKVNAYYIYRWNSGDSIIKDPYSYRDDIIGSGVTDANGFVHIDFERNYDIDYSHTIYFEVTTDDDHMIFDGNTTSMWRYGVDSYSPSYSASKRKVTFMFTDRGLYKPGEKVSYKVIDRELYKGKYSVPDTSKRDFEIKLKEDYYYSDSVYYEKSGTLDNNGCTSGTFVLPDDIEPGRYTITYYNGGDYTNCTIQVQYFERLRFEVKASTPAITYYRGDDVNVDVLAQYLGGGSMSGASYNASWSREAINYRPAGKKYEGMTFGTHQYYDGRTSLNTDSGVLGADGKASLSQKTGGEKILGAPYNYRAEIEVMDSGNQAITAASSVIVHPSRYYLGLGRLKSGGFPKKGTEVRFNYVCVTPDGAVPSAGELPAKKSKALHIELLRESWKEVQQVAWNGQINTRWEKYYETDLDKYEDLTLSAAPVEFTVVPPRGGYYTLRISSTDSAGNSVITERSFYVTGGDWYWWYWSDNSQQLSMTPDKNEYSVGDTAQILLQSPLEKGRYMLTVEREGILEEKVIELKESSSVIDVEIKDSYVPVIYVTLSSFSVRKGQPQNDYNTPDIDKPKPYFGVTTLMVSPESRTFDIEVTTDKKSYLPGEKATIKVHASKNGKALANADITLMAVDRGVIDLINYHVPDPVQFFYNPSRFPLCVYGGDSREYLMDPVTYEVKNLVGGDADGKFSERKNFDPTALFEPSIITDADGNASCTFTLPDTLTAYRITAVGVTGDNFALVESQMDVANPISVRHVLPRKLRLDDVSEVGAVISNISEIDEDVDVTIALYEGTEKTGSTKSANGILKAPGRAEVIDSLTKTISVKSGTTQPLMFNVHAIKNGWITVELTVQSKQVNEKVYLPLEIEKPYIFETVTSIGSVTGDGKKAKKEMIKVPAAEDGVGSFYVQLDPTRLGMLHEAVDYVFRYPYGCMEQRSSKVFPLIVFGDYIDVFDLKSEVADPIEVAVNEINSWENVQKWNGGFPYWPNGTEPNAYVSARIGEILAIAQQKGIRFTKNIDLEKLGSYLISVANDSMDNDYYSSMTAVYQYYVASLLGKKPSASNLAKLEKDIEGYAGSMATLALTYDQLGMNKKRDALVKKIRNRISFTSRGADIDSNDYDYWWGDSTDDYSYCLQLFSKISPDDDVNDHLIFELLKLQSARGYWSSTMSTVRVMVAVNQYILGRNLKNLDFKAVAYLNDKPVLSGEFEGLGAKAVDRRIKFGDISSESNVEVPVEFRKSGTGNLYYTISMKYAIPPEKQEARDEGICVYSEIYDVKTGELVTDNNLIEGNVYKEKVYISSTDNLEYVAMRVPVPAGCEILNAAFATTGSQYDNNRGSYNSNSDYDDDYYYYWYSYNWLSNREIFDAEVQYFWDYFHPTETTVEFMFRATRSGLYNTPCITAECMYEEEIFGRSQGQVWNISK
ncbi:alpha-2-macroglobulin family protein [Treponema sp.]|uniref:alpha-2-macroglobulin family protein n=1 Tax=Treponema sp. TaxID=166 RepID=UPI002600F4F1|nr:alpha-2-macroglobulin family protein [Treponema sp.]MCR5218029.1 Ig-like domain-containing protein [Treponema sp.]